MADDYEQYPDVEAGGTMTVEPPVESRPIPASIDEAQAGYWAALARGEVGPAVRRAAGGVVGSSPGGSPLQIVHATPHPIVPPEGVTLPSSLANQPYVPTDPREREMMAMQRGFENLPVGQAQKAIETALKYQGNQLYRRLLAEGKSPQEALAAAMPLMVGGTGMRGMTMTPYQQASLAQRKREFDARQAAVKPAPQPGEAPITTTKDGQTYYWTGKGWTHVPNVGRPVPQVTTAQKLAVYKQLLKEHGNDDAGTPEWTRNEMRLQNARRELTGESSEPAGPGEVGIGGIRLGAPAGAPAPVAPPAGISIGGRPIGGGSPVAPPQAPEAPAAPMAGAAAAIPLPKDKRNMVVGRPYLANGRIWKWDGKNLIAVKTAE